MNNNIVVFGQNTVPFLKVFSGKYNQPALGILDYILIKNGHIVHQSNDLQEISLRLGNCECTMLTKSEFAFINQ